MSEFRIPHLIGGPHAGQPAPQEWLDRSHRLTTGTYAYFELGDKPLGRGPYPVDTGRLTTYVEQSITYGEGRNRNSGGFEYAGVKLRGLVHSAEVTNLGALLLEQVVKLAQQPPATLEPTQTAIAGYPAHLILELENGRRVEVDKWLVQPGIESPRAVLNIDAIYDAIDQALLKGLDQ